MGRIATLEDVNNAQGGRIIGDIPLNDVYWTILDRFRRQEELSMDEQREFEQAVTGTFSSGPAAEGILEANKILGIAVDRDEEKHQDVDPNALEEVEKEELGEDDDEFDEDDEEDEDEDADLDDTVDELKENEDFAQDNVHDRNDEVS